MRVEVAYALPDRQTVIALDIEAGCTVREAALRSGIAQQFALDLDSAAFGVFGKRVAEPDVTVVQEGDRVEIYRPLLIDPKAVRRERAARNKT